MLPQDFKNWRNRHGLTQAEAAGRLGRSVRSVNALENGAADEHIAVETALACEGIELTELIAVNKPIVLNLIPRAGDERSRRFLRDLLKVERVAQACEPDRIDGPIDDASSDVDEYLEKDSDERALDVIDDRIAANNLTDAVELIAIYLRGQHNRQLAAQQLLRELDSTPDRDAIRKIVKIIAT